jgi:hypothetical protein
MGGYKEERPGDPGRDPADAAGGEEGGMGRGSAGGPGIDDAIGEGGDPRDEVEKRSGAGDHAAAGDAG